MHAADTISTKKMRSERASERARGSSSNISLARCLTVWAGALALLVVSDVSAISQTDSALHRRLSSVLRKRAEFLAITPLLSSAYAS